MKKANKAFIKLISFLLAVICLASCGNTEEKQSNTEAPAESATETESEKEKTGELVFSENGAFYSNTVNLKINCDIPCEIFYTTDGTIPNEKSYKYIGEIKLNCHEIPKCYALSVRAKYEDGSWSDVITRSYIIGDNVKDEFDVPVFSIITDPYNLYDYEYGILVAGKVRDDYLAENPGVSLDNGSPANWTMRGREWEREADLQVLMPKTDSREISQKVGIRVTGGWSRAHDSKPIKIYAREEYGTKKLNYAFFPDAVSEKNGKVINKYKRLILRASGNDDGAAYIRDELIQRLAKKAGVYGTECVAPALLYINGKLQGAYWMHEAYSDEYFEQKYGKFDGYFCINKTSEYTYELDENTKEEKKAGNDYIKAYKLGRTCDVNNDEEYAKLCSLFDIESYLRLWATNIFVANYDWPFNNSIIYRYYAAEGEEYQNEGPFDGRWHFCLHDTDFGLGLMTNSSYDLLNNDYLKYQPTAMFKNLMKRKECREYFLSYAQSLIDGAFSPDSVAAELDKMNEESLKAFELFAKYGDVASKPDFEQLKTEREKIVSWTKRRCYYMKSYYDKKLDKYLNS